MTRNGLSFDVEDWFHVANYEGLIPRSSWPDRELRVVENTERILDLLERKRVRATFFVLGWVAERRPELVRRIVEGGHEVGSHGYGHRSLADMTPAEFRDDLSRSLAVLHDAGARAIRGYRAPNFSVVRSTQWALDILAELGLEYDSSIVPSGAHPRYGMADAPRRAHRVRSSLWEVPLAVLPVGDHRIPCGGGGYFRLFPYSASRWALRRLNAAGDPFVFYLHPWEIDPGQPVVPTSRWRQFRQRVNLSQTLNRLGSLLDDFEFGPVGALAHD